MRKITHFPPRRLQIEDIYTLWQVSNSGEIVPAPPPRLPRSAKVRTVPHIALGRLTEIYRNVRETEFERERSRVTAIECDCLRVNEIDDCE